MKYKHFLRTGGEVEVVNDYTYYFRSGHKAYHEQQISVLDWIYDDLVETNVADGIVKLGPGVYYVDNDWT